jgi:drug/metabolite transporter (DMT)-like permease
MGISLIAFSFSNGISFKTGSLYILVAAVAHALYFILLKPLLTKYEPIVATCYCLWSGTIAMIPLGYGFFEKVSHVAPEYTFSVIYLGIFPAAVAYPCWAAVLKTMDASRAASFLYMVPVVAILIGWAWLNELPSAVSVFGGMVAVAGVIFANRKKRGKAIKLKMERAVIMKNNHRKDQP